MGKKKEERYHQVTKDNRGCSEEKIRQFIEKVCEK